MLEYIERMFSYPFMQRAFLVGILVSLCASLLGVSLVLKRYSMIGDGLSHVGFGALAVASALHMAPLAVAVPVASFLCCSGIRTKPPHTPRPENPSVPHPAGEHNQSPRSSARLR